MDAGVVVELPGMIWWHQTTQRKLAELVDKLVGRGEGLGGYAVQRWPAMAAPVVRRAEESSAARRRKRDWGRPWGRVGSLSRLQVAL